MRLAVVGMKQRFATLQDFDQSRQVVVLVLVLVVFVVAVSSSSSLWSYT